LWDNKYAKDQIRVPKVELFGMLRIKARRADVVVDASTVAEALREVERLLPELRGSLIENGRLAAGYGLSINGLRFLTNLDCPLAPTDALLVVAADPGG
jgi:molybdopterin converting factor small subunit